jgi:hypothetical protein
MWGSTNKAQFMSVFVLSWLFVANQRPTPGSGREGVAHRIMRNTINPCHYATHPLAPAKKLYAMETLDYQLTLALTCCGACG